MAGNSKDSRILAYKDMINQLNKTIASQTELIQSLQKTMEADRLEKETLRQQIEYLTKKLFGTSSEKRKDIESQLNLFDEAEQEADPAWDPELPDDIIVPEHKRKARRTHAELFKNVPSCDEIISLPEEERNCPTCGTQMECIGKEFVRHEFRFTPAKGKVVNIYRETYKCPECAISAEHPDDQTFVKAPVQEPLIPESYASESVVSWAMHQKYQNGLPLNRQEEDWKQLGVPLNRATLANWIIYCTENYLRHVYGYFHRQLLIRKYLMADETRVQVLNEPERNPETDSWMWLFRSGEDGLPPILLYHYTETRAKFHAELFLQGFRGYLETDGYQGYNNLPDIKRCSCWAHVRRYFTDAIPKGKEYDYSLPAVQGVQFCSKQFDCERYSKAKKNTAEQRKQFRFEKEKPILDVFWKCRLPLKAMRMIILPFTLHNTICACLMVPAHDNRMNIGAKGLSGEGYRGHCFWDTEIFLLSYYIFTQPEIARKLEEYRYLSLPGARRKAEHNGYQGVDIETGLLIKVWSGFIEQHITADVAFGVWQ